MEKKSIMIVGTSSGAGKSTFAAALCRIFHKDGFKVAPFKSQNMALKSFLTKEGKEMGVGQAVQAEAANIEADVKMNPILLKPTKDKKIEIFINGEKKMSMTGIEYNEYKKNFVPYESCFRGVPR